MRTFTLTQDINADAAKHWQLFFDDAYDREQYVEGLKYPKYELVERAETPAEIRRTIRVLPKLDLPGPVAKVFGSSFGYTEAGTFDRATQVYRSKTTPNMMAGKLHSSSVVKCEPVGPDRCRRIVELTVECTTFGIGGMVESAFEKNMRAGWTASHEFMNARLARG